MDSTKAEASYVHLFHLRWWRLWEMSSRILRPVIDRLGMRELRDEWLTHQSTAASTSVVEDSLERTSYKPTLAYSVLLNIGECWRARNYKSCFEFSGIQPSMWDGKYIDSILDFQRIYLNNLIIFGEWWIISTFIHVSSAWTQSISFGMLNN